MVIHKKDLEKKTKWLINLPHTPGNFSPVPR